MFSSTKSCSTFGCYIDHCLYNTNSDKRGEPQNRSVIAGPQCSLKTTDYHEVPLILLHCLAFMLIGKVEEVLRSKGA